MNFRFPFPLNMLFFDLKPSMWFGTKILSFYHVSQYFRCSDFSRCAPLASPPSMFRHPTYKEMHGAL